MIINSDAFLFDIKNKKEQQTEVIQRRAKDIATIIYERYWFCFPCQPMDTIYEVVQDTIKEFVVPTYDWIIDHYFELGILFFGDKKYAKKQGKHFKKYGWHNCTFNFSKHIKL